MSEINDCRGQFVRKGSMDAVGVCDFSGFWFSHSDLVKQMEWRGNRLVWTGFMVGRPFVDIPNEQARPPLVQDDPKIVENPRPLGQTNDDGPPDAPTYKVSEAILEQVDFYKPLPAPENLPVLSGPNVSNINYTNRLAILHNSPWISN